MKKEEKKQLIKEFKEWHNKISEINWGHFPLGWRSTSNMNANLKNGCWYWKGYKLVDLYKI